jgi:hypothetical protein
MAQYVPSNEDQHPPLPKSNPSFHPSIRARVGPFARSLNLVLESATNNGSYYSNPDPFKTCITFYTRDGTSNKITSGFSTTRPAEYSALQILGDQY